MKKLLQVISLLQLTKSQPLSGYILGGIGLSETATLAEHHYTATLMGWLLVQKIRAAGGTINERRVVLMLLIHDLSELFGGDISSPLNRKYPDLREHKDKIGERAIQLLSSYLDQSASCDFMTLWEELREGKSDEAVVVKILDQMDHQLFLEYLHYHQRQAAGTDDYRPTYIANHVYALTERIADVHTRGVMNEFLQTFQKDFFNRGYQGLSILMEEASEN